MSLAIADCLVAILVMPMGMIAEVLGHFPLPHYACIIFATMDVLCCTSSIWHMSTMSMDRYFTIRFPFRYGRNKTRRIMLLKIIAVWAISTAVSSPIFVLGLVDKKNVLSNGVCAPNNESFKLYGSVFAFYIPFIIMITTYALTMRSLRNVLVNKRKFNRERRRKQTFQPLAQIVNQYAAIAQSIRRTASINNSATVSTTNTNNNNNNNNDNNNNNNNISHLNNTSYSLLTTTTPRDSRTQSLRSSNSDLNLKQVSNNIQYGSINMPNRTNINNELIHNNNQHLSINYTKPCGSKKRHYYHYQQQQQQPLTGNTGINRIKNDHDMSTVFEIAEYSKSTLNSHDVTPKTSNRTCQRLNVTNEKKQQRLLNAIDSIKQQQMPNTTTITSTISTISPNEVDICSTTDIDSGTEINDLNSIEIVPSTTSIHSTRLNSTDSMSLIIPWQYCFTLIQYILQYYLFIFPYRSRPLAIKYKFNENEFNKRSSILLHQSTSTSSINAIVRKNSQSVSTQTNSLLPLDLSNTHGINNSETHLYSPTKRHQFSFNRTILPSSSLFTKLFRQSSTILLGSRVNSTKSSISLNQHLPLTSSSSLIRQQSPHHHRSSSVFRPIEHEMNYILENDHRPRAASSSVLLHTTYHRRNHASLREPRSLKRRQQYQSSSGYFLTYSNRYTLRRQQQQPFTSSTNTNSSDSLSVFQRINSKYFSTMSNHSQQHQTQSQRLRDEHIVAANERKALKVLLIIFCVFVTLWTPFFICTFISAICEQCRQRISSTVWFSITWLGYSSSMANPFIYTIFSDAFRRAFTNIIFCRPSDSLFPKQFSAKLSYQKSAVPHQPIHQQLSYRRNPNREFSRTSTQISLHPQTSNAGSDATIYINRCASESFR
ncbi:unnamed protein product [Rotaria sp. Silwood1]|nr:unnamed protein product [Rotaria sp. Silwood1]